MFNSIKRFFANWHRIPRHKVPRWISKKLHKQKYVKDRSREYKVEVRRIVRRNYTFSEQLGHHSLVHHKSDIPAGISYFKERTERWKEVKYYYRKIW